MLELHFACTVSMISGTHIWCSLYPTFASISGVPWSPGLDDRGALFVGVPRSGEAALRWVWPLLD